MRFARYLKTLPALGASLLLSGAATAQMSEIAREVAVQRACQVAIWAMPAVSTWDIAQGIINDLGGKVGDVVQLSQPMTSQHGFLTANDVTPYSVAALTTANGPAGYRSAAGDGKGEPLRHLR